MPYTDDEIQASVQKVAQTTVRRNVDSLGVRRVDQTFSDVQEAALGIFLLYQLAPFYVISIGVQRLLEELTIHVQNVLALEQAILNTGRRVLPVTNITPLANANAALFELQSAVAARSSAFSSIEKTPAFQRFSSNLDTFLSQNGPSIKQGGTVVQTPKEAKATILSLLPTVLSAQTDIQAKAAYLQNALNDYAAVNLPAVAAQGIVSRTNQTVAAIVASLTPMTPTDRLETLRLNILDLLTSRAALREMGSFKTPAPIFLVDGSAPAFADAAHPAVPAIVKADIFAPYGIVGSSTLDVAVDGGAPVGINLRNSVLASFSGGGLENFLFTALTAASTTGTVAETFNIVGGVNDVLILVLTDTVSKVSTTVYAGLTAGPARTAAQIAADINTAITGLYLNSQYIAAAGGSGSHYVNISATNTNKGSAASITIPASPAATTLGFVAGTTVRGTDDNRHFIVTVNGTPHAMDFSAGSTSAASAAAQITAALGPNIVGSAQGQTGFQYVVVSYVGPSPFTAQMILPSAGSPAAGVLGMLMDATAYARASTARQVASNLNQAFSGIQASSEVVPIAGGSNVLMRSEPTDPARIIVYKSRGTGTVVPGLGTTLTLNVTGIDLVAQGVLPGDVLVFRDGVNLNTKWTITLVTSTSVTATGVAPAVGGAATYEIGPNLAVSPGYVVQVTTGIQNGTYVVQTIGPTALAVPFEFEIDTILPGSQSPLLQATFFTGNVGQERLTVASKSTLGNSAISLTGVAASLFFGAGSATAVGTSSWVSLPVAVPGLGAGDILEDYEVTYNVPTASYPLLSVDGTTISIAPASVPLTKVFALSTNSLPPFALLRSSAYAAFMTMSQQLATWASLSQNQTVWSKELQRLTNIVLNESAPAPDQVNAALTQLQQLQYILVQTDSPTPQATLEYALLGFSVPSITQVDALIQTFSEKGSDRAIDILLQGRFSDFFGLDMHSVSYAGAMLSQMRTVARNDMPVRKTDRKESTTSRVISSATSPDFEYDVSSIEQQPPNNVPTGFGLVPPTQNDPSKT